MRPKAITKEVWAEMRTKGRDLSYLLPKRPEKKESFRVWNLEGRWAKGDHKREGRRDSQGFTAQLGGNMRNGVTGDLAVLWWSPRGPCRAHQREWGPRSGGSEYEQLFWEALRRKIWGVESRKGWLLRRFMCIRFVHWPKRKSKNDGRGERGLDKEEHIGPCIRCRAAQLQQVVARSLIS